MESVTIKNHPAQEFVFIENEWKSPDDLGNSCANPPSVPGVYFIATGKYNPQDGKAYWHILYVGSSKNLRKRYNTHEVLSEIRTTCLRKGIKPYFWFRPESNFLKREIELIKDILPPYNTQHKKQTL